MVNLYCVITIAITKELRKAEFYFIVVQSVVDYLASGMFNLLFGLYRAQMHLIEACSKEGEVSSLTLNTLRYQLPNGR